MIHFISFSNTKSNYSKDRIIYESKKFELFKSILVYSELDIDDNYMNKNHDHFRFTRGYGYWSWKPYFINKKLLELNYNDILIYADNGCKLCPNNRLILLKWISLINDSGIFSPCRGRFLERLYTRADLVDYINKNYNKNNIELLGNTTLYEATSVIIKKNNNSIRFIDTWNNIMLDRFDLCTDLESSLPNSYDFIENRHDLSVFSLLAKINNISSIDIVYGLYNRTSSPIIAARIKNDKYTWSPNLS